ncbi:MAG TPA: YitT family protein [Chondromyces sp.]|nr:YitT family protein [Chondromyces sp.]
MVQLAGILLGSVIIAIAFNFFLIPHEILSSGVSGISMIVGIVTPINTGIANFVINLPLLILGYMKLGRRFICYTIFSVIIVSAGLYLLPVEALSANAMLSSVFGGALTGLGVGMIFRCSGSSGGFDIIGMILAYKNDFPIGTLLSAMNAAVILASAFIFDWDSVLNTLVSIFVTGKVIDSIHTQHVKLTLMIITSKGEEVKQQLLSNIYRGITVMEGQGAYTNEKRNILLTVVSRYELVEIKKLIQEADPSAFVNISETLEVMGLFHKRI